jgi:hypothetical protein
VVTRHEFLQQLHSVIKPERYLETGVQYGHSLNLAVHSKVAIGIDPYPQTQAKPNQQIFSVTADEFFVYHMAPEDKIDMAFIDGSHLVEDALRDFINIEIHSHGKTVIVFDDVLPLTQDMTSRTMVPGHWTGDVWKIYNILRQYRPDLQLLLVDTEPTGTLVVLNLNMANVALPLQYDHIYDAYTAVLDVPEGWSNHRPPFLGLLYQHL